MTPAPLNLRIYQGANFGPVTIYCQDANGAAVNISGWGMNAFAKDPNGCGKGPVVLDLGANISNAANGEVTLTRNAATTANDQSRTLVWDLVPTNASGAILGPLVAGRVVIVPMQSGTF